MSEPRRLIETGTAEERAMLGAGRSDGPSEASMRSALLALGLDGPPPSVPPPAAPVEASTAGAGAAGLKLAGWLGALAAGVSALAIGLSSGEAPTTAAVTSAPGVAAESAPPAAERATAERLGPGERAGDPPTEASRELGPGAPPAEAEALSEPSGATEESLRPRGGRAPVGLSEPSGATEESLRPRGRRAPVGLSEPSGATEESLRPRGRRAPVGLRQGRRDEPSPEPAPARPRRAVAPEPAPPAVVAATPPPAPPSVDVAPPESAAPPEARTGPSLGEELGVIARARAALADRRPADARALLTDYPGTHFSVEAEALLAEAWLQLDLEAGRARVEAFTAAHPDHPLEARLRRALVRAERGSSVR